MALGSTQPLTEMSTRCISWGKGGRYLRLTTLPTSCAVFMKSGNLNLLETSGTLQACNGTALPLYKHIFIYLFIYLYLSPHGPTFRITSRHTILRNTPLEEWSDRHRDLYETTRNTHNKQTSMPPTEFEPTIPTSERPQVYAFDCAATGIGKLLHK